MHARRALIILLPALLVGLGGYVFARYRADLEHARLHSTRNAAVAHTVCGPIEFAVEGQGEPLLMIHGSGGGYDQGLAFGAPLAHAGFQVIAMSRFGYLGTPLPADASAQAQARAHACLLDALHIRSAAVLGGSAGAPSAMQFAILYPERTKRLVLVVPAAYVPRPGGAPAMTTPAGTRLLFDTALRSDFLFWAAIHLAPRTMMRAILATPPEVVDAAGPGEQARVRRVLDDILPVSPRRLGLLNDAAVTSSLPRYDLDRITAPTLVISAADDLFGTYDGARYTAEHIPNARFIGYPTGGHLLVGHQREETAEIAAFLR